MVVVEGSESYHRVEGHHHHQEEGEEVMNQDLDHHVVVVSVNVDDHLHLLHRVYHLHPSYTFDCFLLLRLLRFHVQETKVLALSFDFLLHQIVLTIVVVDSLVVDYLVEAWVKILMKDHHASYLVEVAYLDQIDQVMEEVALEEDNHHHHFHYPMIMDAALDRIHLRRHFAYEEAKGDSSFPCYPYLIHDDRMVEEEYLSFYFVLFDVDSP